MKQIINIQIERDLLDHEEQYVKGLSEEEKQELIKEHEENTYDMFEAEDIWRAYFKNLEVKFEE